MYLENIFSSFIDFIKSKYDNIDVDQLKNVYSDLCEESRITFLDDKIKNYLNLEKNKKIDTEDTEEDYENLRKCPNNEFDYFVSKYIKIKNYLDRKKNTIVETEEDYENLRKCPNSEFDYYADQYVKIKNYLDRKKNTIVETEEDYENLRKFPDSEFDYYTSRFLPKNEKSYSLGIPYKKKENYIKFELAYG